MHLPQAAVPGSLRAAAKANPTDLLRSARTVAITSRTTFFTPAFLSRALLRQQAFHSLNLKVVEDPRVADLIIQIDRPLFTYDFTFTLMSPSTSVELASGKVIAFDGVHAAPKIAKNLIRILQAARHPQSPPKQGR